MSSSERLSVFPLMRSAVSALVFCIFLLTACQQEEEPKSQAQTQLVTGQATAHVTAPAVKQLADKPRAPLTWMQRLKRVFAIDIERCPDCGGRLRVITCIEEPQLIRKILRHVQGRDEETGSDARGPPSRTQALELL